MKYAKKRISRVSFMFCVLLGWGSCSGGNGNSAAQGAEGGACYPNQTCNTGLSCLSNICVDPTGGGGEADPSMVLQRCLECGTLHCQTQAEACTKAGACGDVVDCWVGCGTNAGCVQDCDVSTLTADDMLAATEYFQCVGANCATECTFSGTVDTSGGGGTDTSGGGGTDTSGGGGTDTGPATGSCSEEGALNGSCVTGALQVCTGGSWVQESCDGCHIVIPSGNCVRIQAITFQQIGEEPVAMPPTHQTFEQTTDRIQADWYLEANQMGVIQFLFANPVDISRIYFVGSQSGVEFVTVETEDGSSGCQYIMNSDGTLRRYVITGTDDFGYQVVHWHGCWGTLSDLGTQSEPTMLRMVNVRTEIASTNRDYTLFFTNVYL